MSRRLLIRLLRRLDASPLPLTDRIRLELESELLDLMTPTIAVRTRSLIVALDDDALNIADTTMPS